MYVILHPQGYADKLKEEGMVDVNLKGEDMKRIRRQQFEVRNRHGSLHCLSPRCVVFMR